jgi:uncharacterized membrane protein YkvA (DUF1232 family)
MLELMVLVIAAVLVCLVIGFVAVRSWRRTDPETKSLIKRITRLPFSRKVRLALALVRDRRLPLRARLIPPGLILYLAMPIDIIPDFIPVLGYMDDVIVMVVGVTFLLRLTPRPVIEEHLHSLEAV